MSRRPVLAALVASLVLAGAAACGSAGGPTGPASAPPPKVGAIAVDPPAGPIGTMFTLTAGGLKEAETVAFEITFPGQGKAYPGAALTVPADGTATTSYRATTANKPGDYQVRLTGAPGSLAEGKFTVTDGPPITSTVTSDTSSTFGSAATGKTATTSRYGRTTTTLKGASTTATSVKASTSTTRRSSSTTPHT